MPNSSDDLRDEFHSAGKAFFSWNSGKNTPNILLQLAERIEGLEDTLTTSSTLVADQLKGMENVIIESSKSSASLARALNIITVIYVILTGAIALATGAQVWLSLQNLQPEELHSPSQVNHKEPIR